MKERRESTSHSGCCESGERPVEESAARGGDVQSVGEDECAAHKRGDIMGICRKVG